MLLLLKHAIDLLLRLLDVAGLRGEVSVIVAWVLGLATVLHAARAPRTRHEVLEVLVDRVAERESLASMAAVTVARTTSQVRVRERRRQLLQVLLGLQYHYAAMRHRQVVLC